MRHKDIHAPTVALTIHCAGAFATENPTECSRTIEVRMPVDIDSLNRSTMSVGWFVTLVEEPGKFPPAAVVLCGSCADALVPEQTRVARKLRSEGPS